MQEIAAVLRASNDIDRVKSVPGRISSTIRIGLEMAAKALCARAVNEYNSPLSRSYRHRTIMCCQRENLVQGGMS